MALDQNSRHVSACPKVCNDIGAFVKKEILEIPSEAIRSKYNRSVNATKDFKPLHQKPASFDNYQNRTVEDFNQDPKYSSEFPEFQPTSDGKIDWTSLAELTGTRPNVTKHSSERYSTNEWERHNEVVLDPSTVHEANFVFYNVKSAINQAFGITDVKWHENTNKLKNRARDVYRWKLEFEECCKAMGKEISFLENERQRVRHTFQHLTLSEAISKECVDLRSNRRSKDLVCDFYEVELRKEKEVLKEVKASLNEILNKIEEQLVANKAAKEAVEYGWSDKTMAYNNSEVVSLGLSPKSNTVMFRPGAVRYIDSMSTPEMYDGFCRKTILDSETTRQRSIDLRGGIQVVLETGARLLKKQADTTDIALTKTVSHAKETMIKMREALLVTLSKIADMEILIERLQRAILKLDAAMKLVQTRLDIRNQWRPNAENCRDSAQHGLVEEVKQIHETVASLQAQLTNANRTRQLLMEQRQELERELAVKMQTIIIDNERCQVVRLHFPNVSEICGTGR